MVVTGKGIVKKNEIVQIRMNIHDQYYFSAASKMAKYLEI